MKTYEMYGMWRTWRQVHCGHLHTLCHGECTQALAFGRQASRAFLWGFLIWKLFQSHHFHPFPSISIHFHPFPSISIHFHPFPSFNFLNFGSFWIILDHFVGAWHRSSWRVDLAGSTLTWNFHGRAIQSWKASWSCTPSGKHWMHFVGLCLGCHLTMPTCWSLNPQRSKSSPGMSLWKLWEIKLLTNQKFDLWRLPTMLKPAF